MFSSSSLCRGFSNTSRRGAGAPVAQRAAFAGAASLWGSAPRRPRREPPCTDGLCVAVQARLRVWEAKGEAQKRGGGGRFSTYLYCHRLPYSSRSSVRGTVLFPQGTQGLGLVKRPSHQKEALGKGKSMVHQSRQDSSSPSRNSSEPPRRSQRGSSGRRGTAGTMWSPLKWSKSPRGIFVCRPHRKNPQGRSRALEKSWEKS